MNLVVDQGNTRCKLALFEQAGALLRDDSCTELTAAVLDAFLDGQRPKAAILSSVKVDDPVLKEVICHRVDRLLLFSTDTPLPLTVAYGSPASLGLDRLAAAVGAMTLQPGRPLLVIDMGTAITYDLVTADGYYLGGNIAPGLRLRFEALNEKTGHLPRIQPKLPFESFGIDTETAIRAGVMQGIVHEINGYLRQHQTLYPDLFAFLTGGDGFYFAETLKSGIFASKNLVLIGLNTILNHHA